MPYIHIDIDGKLIDIKPQMRTDELPEIKDLIKDCTNPLMDEPWKTAMMPMVAKGVTHAIATTPVITKTREWTMTVRESLAGVDITVTTKAKDASRE